MSRTAPGCRKQRESAGADRTERKESRVKRLSLYDRAEVLPALHRRSVTPAAKTRRSQAKATFDQRVTRASRFPVEQAIARSPESPWLGRFLDIEV